MLKRWFNSLDPVQKHQWSMFTANRRAYYSLWIFLILFTISLFAEFIANDKPILVKYENSFYVPVLKSYPETTFNGDFDTEADYKDPYVKDLINKQGWMLWPPIKYHYLTHITDLPTAAPSPPTRQNWLGTDDQARDVTAQLIYGFRLSILFALTLTILSTVIGVFVGAVQGFYGGKIDLIGQRLLEIWSGLPALFLLIILSGIITPNFWWLLGIMLLFSWTQLVDVVRAEFLRGRNLDYVKAAKALGVSNMTVMKRHVLPNALVATFTFVPFIMAGSISSLAALDFLGFGMPPEAPSLGKLITQGKNNLHAPWLGISIFLMLSCLLTLLVFIGEGIRDAFDPRLVKAMQNG